MEVHYNKNQKNSLGTKLTACQRCADDVPSTSILTCEPPPSEPLHHHYFDQNICKDVIMAYVDGCSFHHEAQVLTGVGVIWVNNIPYDPKKFQMGLQTSQYAEIAGILVVQNVKTF
ncbi:hypothetical protein ABVT39_024985 [Epinephelus coioides]